MKTDRYALANSLVELLEGPLREEGFDLLDARVFAGGGRLTLRLFLDAEGGMTLQRCADASRTAEMLLDEADLIPGAYVIEASSPGVRRPLRTPAHFADAVGQDVVLKLAGSGSRQVRGRLAAADADGIVIEPRAAAGAEAGEEPARRIRLAELREANLDPEFDAQALINADRRRRKEEKKEIRRERREARQKKRESARDESSSGDGS